MNRNNGISPFRFVRRILCFSFSVANRPYCAASIFKYRWQSVNCISPDFVSFPIEWKTTFIRRFLTLVCRFELINQRKENATKWMNNVHRFSLNSVLQIYWIIFLALPSDAFYSTHCQSRLIPLLAFGFFFHHFVVEPDSIHNKDEYKIVKCKRAQT